ncbi:putative Regulator of competence-specific genes [Vibrio nigripulchritudo MADA3029]|uniref:Regulator of competence-specific genes n=1 Tax=Vibrio nigripulchritudo SOn1 TaxID=1238450 RepID=A0AAV2VK12_9VIBR|nr:TfoX/Sxy family protein [Vibrio nigripulchritudo]CCN37903.1 putative Regulator of competence-specific genes [Vibrio nigripulchritudo AM115]CCN41279.1 putative Regulator of competence-specific genes [Vibrio nigripulchritudo FTn2]CCN49592.1 putative Regulator of competence-specific genes [Vibrio nigripulchritudo MADA3020]CCN53674.1 putative Regulator of competence-specific genes [Vibrio nigripulchritudo MADA3021]CCN58507.1 putative Regulator of competence-specific genes [Vibrio nigripulchritu
MNVNVDSTILIAQRFGRVSSRAMFGGTGIFCDDIIFAVARDEHVFLRAGDKLKGQLVDLGCGECQPEAQMKGDFKIAAHYFSLHSELDENSFVKAVDLSIEAANHDHRANQPLRLLPNVRRLHLKLFRRIGIGSMTDLQQDTTANIVSKIVNLGLDLDVSPKLLYEIEGARTGQHWTVLPEEEKRRLDADYQMIIGNRAS